MPEWLSWCAGALVHERFKSEIVGSRVAWPRMHGGCLGPRIESLQGTRACTALGGCTSDTLG